MAKKQKKNINSKRKKMVVKQPFHAVSSKKRAAAGKKSRSLHRNAFSFLYTEIDFPQMTIDFFRPDLISTDKLVVTPAKRIQSTSVGKVRVRVRKAKNNLWMQSTNQVAKDIQLLKLFLSQPIPKGILISAFVLITIVGGLFYWYILKDLPNPASLTNTPSALTTRIMDRNGKLLYRVYKNANRTKLNWEEIPDIVKNSTIAIEDSNFYHHIGVSFKGILRAALHNTQEDDINLYQGGSTITQQLVKNRLLSAERTYTRKIKEVILALWTELVYSKKDILTFYLSEVGYGGPAYGIEAASQMYFGKSAKNLSLSEAAFLAGLPAAPTTFSPFGPNPQLAYIRQKQVLDRMVKQKMISKGDYDTAISEKLVLAPQKTDIEAPHFVMFVRDNLVNKLGEQKVTEGGFDVYTTLDLDLQNKAQEIVSKQIRDIKDKYNIHSAAALVTNPKNGEILAMVGSPNYFDIQNKGYVNATTALRQPGSSIKVVNYSYALDRAGYTPTSIIDDSPVAYRTPGSKEVYVPKNYDGNYHGRVTLRSALANSYNIPAVKVLNSYGVSNMIEQGKKMGIRSWDSTPPVGLSLTLGSVEVTMLDMARVYGTLANMGARADLNFIKEIKNSDGVDVTNLFYNRGDQQQIIGSVLAQDNEQVVSPLAAYWLTDILSDENARLPAFGRYAKLSVPNHKVAVKTGTSNDFRDNWTIGFTPDTLTVVWVGNADGSFMKKNLVSGITGAAPIWNEVMTTALIDKQPAEFEIPKGLIPVKICAVNGLLTCQYCPSEKTEYFTADKVPTKKCSFRSPDDCTSARTQSEGKSDDEKKQMLAGCPS